MMDTHLSGANPSGWRELPRMEAAIPAILRLFRPIISPVHSIEKEQRRLAALNTSACGIFTLHSWEFPCEPGAPEMSLLEETLEQHLSHLIEQNEISDFWLVMDQGLSCCVAERILARKQTHALRLTCVIPFEEQHLHWPEKDRDRYFSILERCDREYLLAHHFSINCYQQSVQLLLSQCAFLFVIWNGRLGDAGDAIQYAQRSKHHVRSLNVTQCNSSQ